MKALVINANEHVVHISISDEHKNQILILRVTQPKCDETKRILTVERIEENIEVHVLN